LCHHLSHEQKALDERWKSGKPLCYENPPGFDDVEYGSMEDWGAEARAGEDYAGAGDMP
jgi:hypothetical protein